MQDKLANIQSKIDKIYEEEGLTDEVLDVQLEINKIRHEHDITDENEIIYEGYVQ